jgi:hypothetical protein
MINHVVVNNRAFPVVSVAMWKNPILLRALIIIFVGTAICLVNI